MSFVSSIELRVLVEVDRAIHIVAVGQGERGHLLFFGRTDQGLGQHRALKRSA